jgi:hypothetical protein
MNDKLPIRATTQQQIPLEDIIDNLVVLKNGCCCYILSITALNFSLLSEAEQESTIYAYAALLNSLTFPVQIVISSRRKDITSYLNILLEKENKETNLLMQGMIKRYRKFIEEMIKKNNVLDKQFYLVIPFFPIELGINSATPLSFMSSPKSLPFSKSYLVEKAKISLNPKKDHLIRQFARIGLSATQLNTQELTTLFYEIYNAEQSESQKITPEAQYSSLAVQSVKTNQPVPTEPISPVASH